VCAQVIEQGGLTVDFPDGKKFTFRYGDRIMMIPPVSHHDPEIFADPESFKVTMGLESSGLCDADNTAVGPLL
jgi:hypothetical protein